MEKKVVKLPRKPKIFSEVHEKAQEKKLEAVQETPKVHEVPKVKEKQPKKPKAQKKEQSKNRVFKITLTAVYSNSDVEEDQISDGVFEAMTKAGKGLSLLHVDSIKKVVKADEAIVKILKEVSEQNQESMKKVTTESGTFVSVDNDKESK